MTGDLSFLASLCSVKNDKGESEQKPLLAGCEFLGESESQLGGAGRGFAAAGQAVKELDEFGGWTALGKFCYAHRVSGAAPGEVDVVRQTLVVNLKVDLSGTDALRDEC
jgi:hypothetical protein